jgi:hypothetical protein
VWPLKFEVVNDVKEMIATLCACITLQYVLIICRAFRFGCRCWHYQFIHEEIISKGYICDIPIAAMCCGNSFGPGAGVCVPLEQF